MLKYFIFMDFFTVKVDKVTGSDVIVGMLLERNSVCNRELYVFLIISCTRTNTKGILASKNMPNRGILYALSNFDCKKSPWKWYFWTTSCVTFFLRRIQILWVRKIPKHEIGTLKYLIFLNREFIDKAINEFAQNHPNIAVYVTKRHGRHPRIVANYCKYSKSGKVLAFSL